MSAGTGMTEQEVRARFLALRAKVFGGTATDIEALEAADLLTLMKAFEEVRQHEPRPL